MWQILKAGEALKPITITEGVNRRTKNIAEKTRISPAVCAMPDEKHENLHIEIELPGVEKEDISLQTHKDSFFIKAPGDDLEFAGSYAVCCPVEVEKARARYRNGLLSIDIPCLKTQEHAKQIPVQ